MTHKLGKDNQRKLQKRIFLKLGERERDILLLTTTTTATTTATTTYLYFACP